jgi:hypothetical protein
MTLNSALFRKSYTTCELQSELDLAPEPQIGDRVPVIVADAQSITSEIDGVRIKPVSRDTPNMQAKENRTLPKIG